MVGVVGKSKACNACRKRRVKCDLGRPSCQRCKAIKQACTGYDREVVYIHRTPRDASSTALTVLSGLQAQRRLSDARAAGRASSADLHRLFAATSPHSDGGTAAHTRFRRFALSLLRATYLPRQSASLPLTSTATTASGGGSAPGVAAAAETSEGSFSWVYRLTDLVAPSRALDTSLYAFCLAQLQVTDMGGTSLYECLDQYNIALQHLNVDLDNPSRRFCEETLAAILVLSTCELFVSPTENGWSVHARGIVEILKVRDPAMTGTPAWRHLLSRMRVVCTVEAMTKRQANLLESNIWRQIMTESGFNDALDGLYRLLGDIPTVLERALALPSLIKNEIFLKESGAAAYSLLATVNSVESWYESFSKASPKPRYWLIPSRATNPTDADPFAKVFPSCFDFESLSVAVTCVMCWAVFAQLYSNVIQIHDLVQARADGQIELGDILANAEIEDKDVASWPEAASRDAPLSGAVGKRSIQDIRDKGSNMACFVCQSMEYYHRIEMGTYSGHAITYPSWSARQYFRLHPGHEREGSWLQNMSKMQGVGTRWGLLTMAFADIDEPLGGWLKENSHGELLRKNGESVA